MGQRFRRSIEGAHGTDWIPGWSLPKGWMPARRNVPHDGELIIASYKGVPNPELREKLGREYCLSHVPDPAKNYRELDNDAHLNEPFARGCHEVTCEESRTLRKKREEAAKKAGDASKGKQKKVEGKKKK